MAKKITYKVVAAEPEAGENQKIIENTINKHTEKGWILDKVVTGFVGQVIIIFKDK